MKSKAVALKFICFALQIPIFILTSCDPAIGYEYYINNKSVKELNVLYRGNGFRDSTENIMILPRTKILLYEVSVWGKNPHDEKDDFLLMIDTLNIRSTDTSMLTLEYLKRESWSYDNDIVYFGFIKTGTNIYTLEITNDDFE